MKLIRWTLAAALVLSAPAALARSGASAAKPAKAVRTIELTVTSDGFTPSDVKVKAGEPVKLVVTRKTEKTCATEIVIRDLGIKKDLPLNKPVTVELTPKKAGTLRYACAMDMIAGTITVE